jgi:hypothetical protein
MKYKLAKRKIINKRDIINIKIIIPSERSQRKNNVSYDFIYVKFWKMCIIL